MLFIINRAAGTGTVPDREWDEALKCSFSQRRTFDTQKCNSRQHTF